MRGDEWKKSSPEGKIGYFDYGLLQKDGTIKSANQYYNPDMDNNEIGDFFPEYPVQKDYPVFYIYKDQKEWTDSMYDEKHQFNIEVWCFSCVEE